MRAVYLVPLTLALTLARPAYAESLKVATWNIENLRPGSRTPEELEKLRALVDLLDADVVALQEVDGPEAAAEVFDPDAYAFHFSSRNNPQRTGFAIRKDVRFTPHPDFAELDVSGVRRGTDVTVMLGERPLRLLSVHLKSGCHQADLDGVSPTSDSACGKLRRQLPILEAWIDARAEEDTPFVVLGDFNRRFNLAGDDFWAEIDDGEPRHADLTKHTEGLKSACLDFRFPEYIDHIVTDLRASELVEPGSFRQVLLEEVDPDGEARLSDHCPIAVVFETGDGEPGVTGEVVDRLLRRLDAMQRELDAVRVEVEGLRE